MARLIDLDELLQYPLRRGSEHYNEKNADPHFLFGVESVLEYAQTLPTLTKPNEPLTMKELRKMNGQPVWLAEKKVWALLQVWDDDNIDAVFSMPIGCFHAEPIIGTKIYRHPLPEPPEEE